MPTLSNAQEPSGQSTFLFSEAPARASPSPESEREWMTLAASWHSSPLALLMRYAQLGSSLKTFLGCYPVTPVKQISRWRVEMVKGKATRVITSKSPISPPSFAGWRSAGILAHGQVLTLSGSGFPRDASVSSLSDILETGAVPQRFFLSSTACRGILRRAEKRGKELPARLALALRAVADSGPISISGGGLVAEGYGGNNTGGAIEVATACNAHGGPHGRLDFESETFIVAALDASYGRLQGCSGQDARHGHSHLLAIPILAGARTGKSTDDPRAGLGIGEDGDPMYTLQSGKQHAVAIHGTQNPIISDIAHPLQGNQGQENAIIFRACGQDGFDASQVSPPLCSTDGGGTVPTVAWQESQTGLREYDTAGTAHL